MKQLRKTAYRKHSIKRAFDFAQDDSCISYKICVHIRLSEAKAPVPIDTHLGIIR
ncbi:hypothetical protein ACFPXN_16050 [Flavobacterium salmonis]